MGCFTFLKTKSKRRHGKDKPKSGAGTVVTEAISTSNYDTSRSGGSAGGQHPSKSSASTSSQRSISTLFEEKASGLRVFDLAELRSATNDFSRMLKLGEGGFGSVYKGFIKPEDAMEGRITVAVKVLNQKGLQGHKQWLAEVQYLGILEHPNLVKLVGYCSDDGERGIQRLLVYEYMPNKSLDYHLFSRSVPPIPWNVRLQIALAAAEGLAYLHEGLEIQVIYRDFKASNVLLDNEFHPKLSDFGLAREGPDGDRTHVSTAVVGTHGYAAPDYIATGHLTTKSDVWSFGVVLYELLTGRRVLDRNRPTSEQKLLDWVKQFPIESKKFSMIMDPKLRNQYSPKSAREVARLANMCLAKHGKERPAMSQVVAMLKQAAEITEAAGPGKLQAEGESTLKVLDKGK